LIESRYTTNHLKKKRNSWWSPLWRGLVADSEGKHRKTMGSAIWTYLYLLMYMKRASGLVFRQQAIIAKETGFSIRAIQKHLAKLKRANYISTEKTGNSLKIHITNWKTFRDHKINEH
jgi:hypothetical protein